MDFLFIYFVTESCRHRFVNIKQFHIRSFSIQFCFSRSLLIQFHLASWNPIVNHLS